MNRGRNFDVNSARADREFRMNPPKNAPGQGSFDEWNIDTGVGSMDNNLNFGGDDLFGGLGNQGGNQINNSSTPSQLDWSGGSTQNVNGVLNNGVSFQNNQQIPQSAPRRTFEDLLEDILVKGVPLVGKAIWVFFNEFAEAIKDNKLHDTYNTSFLCCLSGLSTLGLFLVLIFFSKFTDGINANYALLPFLSGAFVCILGIVGIMALHSRVKGDGEEEESYNKVGSEEGTSEELFAMFEKENESDFDFPEDIEEDDFPANEDEEDLFANWGDDELDEPEKIVGGIYEEDINVDSLVEDIENTTVPVGMYTRQYLFETFSKVLPLINPNFSSMKNISSGDETFLQFEDMIREAAELKGVYDDDLPNLLELKKNMFMYQMSVERTKGCIGKEETIANEVVNMYKVDENGQIPEEKKGVYATVNPVGSVFYISLFLSNCPMVTLGDIYSKEKDFILNPKNKKPFVWGINEFGKVWKCDVDKTNTYIISGSPRGGKSWKAQSLLLQLCMFSSPDEINIHVFDSKDNTSDYYVMSSLIPHFKSFNGTKEKILAKLRYLTTKEAERRRNLLKKYNKINIADLKAKEPDVKLPYLYIVIDEMQGLMDEMSKEEREEFQGYLSTLTSKYPNLGYRAIFIPHRIVNQVISKSVYPLVNCRVSVMQTFEEIKNGLEITRKEFPYNLPNKGDMALRTIDISNNEVVFCHAEVVTSSNDLNNDVYRYVGAVWKKLCPGCEEDMVGANSAYISREPVDRSIGVTEDDKDTVSVDTLFDEDGDLVDFWE